MKREVESMFFRNKRILIIGGTGTIGKSIAKLLLKQEPEIIRILSRDSISSSSCRMSCKGTQDLAA